LHWVKQLLTYTMPSSSYRWGALWHSLKGPLLIRLVWSILQNFFCRQGADLRRRAVQRHRGRLPTASQSGWADFVVGTRRGHLVPVDQLDQVRFVVAHWMHEHFGGKLKSFRFSISNRWSFRHLMISISGKLFCCLQLETNRIICVLKIGYFPSADSGKSRFRSWQGLTLFSRFYGNTIKQVISSSSSSLIETLDDLDQLAYNQFMSVLQATVHQQTNGLVKKLTHFCLYCDR